MAAFFCFFPLEVVINACVTSRIAVPFISQIAAVRLLRRQQPQVAMPFRMWLYPLPALVALLGWIFVLVGSSLDDIRNLYIALGVSVSGCAAFAIWQFARRLRRTP